MRSSMRHIFGVFPWLSKGRIENSFQHTMMATELRGLGGSRHREKEDISYTSLRDIMGPPKFKYGLSMPWEIEEAGYNTTEGNLRMPKNRLLEKAAQAWLLPSVGERSQKQTRFLSRCWLKLTNQTSSSPSTASWSDGFRLSLSDYIANIPILRWIDPTQALRCLVSVERLRHLQRFAFLRG